MKKTIEARIKMKPQDLPIKTLELDSEPFEATTLTFNRVNLIVGERYTGKSTLLFLIETGHGLRGVLGEGCDKDCPVLNISEDWTYHSCQSVYREIKPTLIIKSILGILEPIKGVKSVEILKEWLSGAMFLNGGILIWENVERGLDPMEQDLIAQVLLGLGRIGIQIFMTTQSYFISNGFDVCSKDCDDVGYISLYRDGSVIKCEQRDCYCDLDHNIIREASMDLYHRKIARYME